MIGRPSPRSRSCGQRAWMIVYWILLASDDPVINALGFGEGPCSGRNECDEGLQCVANEGIAFLDEAPYHAINICVDALWNPSPRRRFCQWIDRVVESQWGRMYCSPWCPCENDRGHCRSDRDCTKDHFCVAGMGEIFGTTKDTSVCVSRIESGPTVAKIVRFLDGLLTTFHRNRGTQPIIDLHVHTYPDTTRILPQYMNKAFNTFWEDRPDGIDHWLAKIYVHNIGTIESWIEMRLLNTVTYGRLGLRGTVDRIGLVLLRDFARERMVLPNERILWIPGFDVAAPDPNVELRALNRSLAYGWQHQIPVPGLKIHPYFQDVGFDDARWERAFKNSRGKFLFIHTGNEYVEKSCTFTHSTQLTSDTQECSPGRMKDPAPLERWIQKYPDVQVVLSHVGQSERLMVPCLDLATNYPNVWLEIANLNVTKQERCMCDPDPDECMNIESLHFVDSVFEHTWLRRDRNGQRLWKRVLYGSSGPQYPSLATRYKNYIDERTAHFARNYNLDLTEVQNDLYFEHARRLLRFVGVSIENRF